MILGTLAQLQLSSLRILRRVYQLADIIIDCYGEYGISDEEWATYKSLITRCGILLSEPDIESQPLNEYIQSNFDLVDVLNATSHYFMSLAKDHPSLFQESIQNELKEMSIQTRSLCEIIEHIPIFTTPTKDIRRNLTEHQSRRRVDRTLANMTLIQEGGSSFKKTRK